MFDGWHAGPDPPTVPLPGSQSPHPGERPEVSVRGRDTPVAGLQLRLWD